jgi:uncharacterized protein
MSGEAETPEPTDDLSKPLGQKKPKRRSLVVPTRIVARAIAGLLGACVAVLAGWMMFVDEPYGGEPMAIVSADAHGGPQAAKPGEKPGEPAAKPDAAAPATPAVGDTAGQGQTVTIIDGTTGKRQEITVGGPRPKDAKPAKPDTRSELTIDPRLIETTRHGGIPKVATDGTRPADVYAQPVRHQAGKGDGPRIAIVIEGLGVGANTTAEALSKLPPEVTCAFSPYGTDVERWVDRARSEGHEVLLQVGMEPFDFPDNDPGPQTLLADLSPEQNVDRLHWFMSRFQGYVGISPLMGARFTATDQLMAPVLRDIGRRGLIYFDDGSSPRSVAGQVAGASNVSFVRADAVLDSVATANEIDGALARLEQTARARGTAIAAAGMLPVTIDRIAQWLRGAEERGITLVPISAVATRVKTAS